MFASRALGIALCIIALTSSQLFRFPYITPKFIAFSIFVFFASVFCFLQPIKLVFPKIKNIGWLLFLLSICLVGSAFSQVPGERVTGFIHICMSILLIIATLAFARIEKTNTFIREFISVQIPFLIFMFSVLAYKAFFTDKSPAPFFHGFNIAGGFVAIATLQLYFWGEESKRLFVKRTSYAFIILGIILILHFQARAALLGLLAALLFSTHIKYNFFKLFSHTAIKKHHKITLITLITLGLLLSCGAAFIFFQKGLESMAIRFSFWGNTLCLIRDYPWGIGPGAFEYVFQAYNGRCFLGQEISEAQLIDHPHNMFLEFIAEIGLVGFLLLAVFFYLIYKDFFKFKTKKSLEYKWINSSLLLILSNALFEFPQGTAYSLFYLSVLLGVLCASTKNTQELPSYFKSIHLAFSFLVASIFLIKGASIILTVRADIKDNYVMACSLDKENWRACYRVASKHIQEKNFDEAEKLIENLAKKFEGHHPLLALKGEYAEAQGDLKTACKFYKEYDNRFAKKSLLSKYILEKCTEPNP